VTQKVSCGEGSKNAKTRQLKTLQRRGVVATALPFKKANMTKIVTVLTLFLLVGFASVAEEEGPLVLSNDQIQRGEPAHLFENGRFYPKNSAIAYPSSGGGYCPSSFQIVSSYKGKGPGRASLIGKRDLQDGSCRYVFLSATHVFTGEARASDEKNETPTNLFTPLYLAAPGLPKMVTRYSVRLHPETAIHTTRVSETKYDIALFSLDAPCVAENEFTPFDIYQGDVTGRPGYINQNSWLFPPASGSQGDKQYEKLRTFRTKRNQTLEGTLSPHVSGNSNYVLKFKPGFFALGGDSGSAVFVVNEGRYEVAGVLMGKLTNRKDANYALVVAGNEAREWISKESEQMLLGEGESIEVNGNTTIELPKRYFYPPRNLVEFVE